MEQTYSSQGASDDLADLRRRLHETYVELMRRRQETQNALPCQEYIDAAGAHAVAAQAALDAGDLATCELELELGFPPSRPVRRA